FELQEWNLLQAFAKGAFRFLQDFYFANFHYYIAFQHLLNIFITVKAKGGQHIFSLDIMFSAFVETHSSRHRDQIHQPCQSEPRVPAMLSTMSLSGIFKDQVDAVIADL